MAILRYMAHSFLILNTKPVSLVVGTGQVPENGSHSSLSDALLYDIRRETCETCCRYRHAKDRSLRIVAIPH